MLKFNTVHQIDCIEAMSSMNEESVDLAFADPPFNIGFKYDVYDDRKDAQSYLDWSQKWISGVHRVLKPTGAFWLAIGDEYAAELKILSQQVGFHCRSWVVWYYTFGVNCKKKFSRSHVHIFHFVKDLNQYVFNGTDIAVPSARQLVYADSRAAKGGRLPDDTWILRPQDLTDGFNADEDVWYFPRVAGTFKEREGYHGCQMPEQLLGRIVRVSSKPDDLVMDPFIGSATTMVAAKKLNRRFIGFDISEDYIIRGLSRLAGCETGDRLEGSPEPTVSAPATPDVTKTRQRRKTYVVKPQTTGTMTLTFDPADLKSADVETLAIKVAKTPAETPRPQVRSAEFERAIVDAFRETAEGFSVDRVVADPDLNRQFLKACATAKLTAEPKELNKVLFRVRKLGLLQSIPTREVTEFPWEKTDLYSFASEIALRRIHDTVSIELDEILCDPELAVRFDQAAMEFAPGFSPIEYRWAALKFLKLQQTASERISRLAQVELPEPFSALERGKISKFEGEPGIYLIYDAQRQPLYAGETLNLGRRMNRHFDPKKPVPGWTQVGSDQLLSILPYAAIPRVDLSAQGNALRTWLVAYQRQIIERETPRLNFLGFPKAQ